MENIFNDSDRVSGVNIHIGLYDKVRKAMKDGVLSAPEDAKLPEIRGYALPAVMTTICLY